MHYGRALFLAPLALLLACAGRDSGNSAAATASGSSSTSSGASGSGGGGVGGNGGSVGPKGGTLDVLSFAIVGDTRPPTPDDTAGYPTAVITKIWQQIQAASPRPAFAVTTGDYMFANTWGNESSKQLDIYLKARSAFQNTVFPAMGNHECTSATASNCIPGGNGMPNNYVAFLAKMLAPLGIAKPYYTVDIGSTTGGWTAKFVVIAANAWDATQDGWFAAELAKPTTYTFVVRHEGSNAKNAPGVLPSKKIMDAHPYTMLIAGHSHTFEYFPADRELIVGNGGAPLTGGIGFGYVLARQRADGAIVFEEFESATNALQMSFAVKADGTPVP